jgi:NADH:ubiquinone oxidoreductase subunit 2 (subunit N)
MCENMSHEIILSEVLVVTYLYMVVYNVSLILFFLVLFQVLQGDVRAMSALGKFGIDPIKSLLLVVALCSMAGVPPMLGFFTKLLVLVLVANSSFPVFFVFFAVLLLVGLYFYMQNIRFLYNDSLTYVEHPFGRETVVMPFIVLSSQCLAFFLLLGVFLYDDMLQILFWVLL